MATSSAGLNFFIIKVSWLLKSNDNLIHQAITVKHFFDNKNKKMEMAEGLSLEVGAQNLIIARRKIQ
jgi:hypothetical protein